MDNLTTSLWSIKRKITESPPCEPGCRPFFIIRRSQEGLINFNASLNGFASMMSTYKRCLHSSSEKDSKSEENRLEQTEFFIMIAK